MNTKNRSLTTCTADLLLAVSCVSLLKSLAFSWNITERVYVTSTLEANLRLPQDNTVDVIAAR